MSSENAGVDFTGLKCERQRLRFGENEVLKWWSRNVVPVRYIGRYDANGYSRTSLTEGIVIPD